jgi:hypothetical protein
MKNKEGKMTLRTCLRCRRWPCTVVGIVGGGLALTALAAQGLQQDTKVVQASPGSTPKGALLLFGRSEDDLTKNWVRRGTDQPATWKVVDGGAVARGGDIVTREKFTDFQLHAEFKVPLMPNAKGQGRGNSGIFLQGRYEIQVLDSYGLADPGTGDCGAVYGQAAPLVNGCKPPEEWQAYDITYRAPRFDEAGKMVEKGRVTVLQNGIAIQNNTEINAPTWGEKFGGLETPGPIVLQDHGNTVQYRNIWILPLPLKGAAHY